MVIYMKIALLIPTLHLGGAEKVMLNLAKGFIKDKHQVFLVCGTVSGELYKEIPKGINIIDLKIKRMRFAICPLIIFLKKENPDILYTAFRGNNLIAIIAKKIACKKVKVFVSEHGIEKLSDNIYGRIKKYIYRLTYKEAAGIVAVSNGLAQNMAKELGIPISSITTIHNPVIDEDNHQKEDIVIPDNSFNHKVPVILSAGRLVAEKGFKDLIIAFNTVRKERDAKLIILGEGPYRKELEALILELNLENHVKLYGYTRNPTLHMEKCDVFVLNSLKEGFGNVIVEALYCGVQVVSTNCPFGPSEILAHGKYGTLVPVGDINSLVKSIEDILDKKIFYTGGRERAKDFTIDKISKEYIDLFNE